MSAPRAGEVFHPGVLIEEELEARDWSRTDLAAILGRDVSLVGELIAKKRSVTPETAQGLADAFGTSYELWSNLQAAYDRWTPDYDSR
jgi:HTH-type transcriptional regulator/antitoxin HigA